MNGQPQGRETVRKASNAGFGYIGLKDSVSRLPWKESYPVYLHLKEAMETEVAGSWKDGKLAPGAVGRLARIFGVDRLGTLLSYNIYRRLKEEDVTWSNKAWAGAYRTPTSKDQFGEACIAQIPAPSLNALADQYRAYVIERDLHGEECCLTGSDPDGGCRGRVLMLRPDNLPESRLCGDNQFFYARSGFGCEPGKTLSRVFGVFLKTGEEASFRRNEFIGFADMNRAPDWAKNAYSALCESDCSPEPERSLWEPEEAEQGLLLAQN